VAQKSHVLFILAPDSVGLANPAKNCELIVGFMVLRQRENHKRISSQLPSGKLLCRVNHLHAQAFADGAGDGLQMDCAVFRIKQPVQLGTAASHAFGHRPFADLARLHCFRKLPGKNALDGRRLTSSRTPSPSRKLSKLEPL
jgi:hypothetical protein